MARFVRGFLYTVSGDIVEDGVHESGWAGFFPKGERLIDQLVVPETLPQLDHRGRRGLLRRRTVAQG